MAWRTFSIHVDGFDAFTMSAASRSKARYEAWLRFREPYPDRSFRDFQQAVTVRSCGAPAPPVDGYDYVRRNYGVDVRIGQRVRLVREGASSGQEGEVVYPGPSTAHVHVVIDGLSFPVTVHPSSIEILEAA